MSAYARTAYTFELRFSFVNNNPETMDRSRPHAQVGSCDIVRHAQACDFVSPKCTALSCPHAEEPRLRSAHADFPRAPARRLEACGHAVLTLRDARTHVRCRGTAAACALLRARTDERMPRSRLVAEPLPCRRFSRCQTAHVVSFPHAFARGLALLSPTGSRGGRSADRHIFLSLSRLSARVSRAGEARRVCSLARTHARLSALHRGVCRPGP